MWWYHTDVWSKPLTKCLIFPNQKSTEKLRFNYKQKHCVKKMRRQTKWDPGIYIFNKLPTSVLQEALNFYSSAEIKSRSHNQLMRIVWTNLLCNTTWSYDVDFWSKPIDCVNASSLFQKNNYCLKWCFLQNNINVINGVLKIWVK